jgi:hypothetical protein
MALQALVIARVTQPHIPTLAGTLAPLLAVANAGSFTLRYGNGVVVIEQGSFTGVNQASVESAVAAAPEHSEALEDKRVIDDLPKWHKALFLTTLDQINVLRQTPLAVLSAITPSQAWNAVKTKYDSL